MALAPSLSSSPEVTVVAYSCYFVRVDHAPMLQTIESDEGGEAITQATTLSYARPEHFGIEVWKDTRLLARVSKSKSAELQQRAS